MKTLIAAFTCIICLNVYASSLGELGLGKKLPEVNLKGLLVKTRNLSDYRGKPLIINVWASWCGPCQEEMASIERLNQKFGGKQLNIIGISTDDDSNAAISRIIKAKLGFENYIDQHLQMEHMLGADTIPLTILIDAQGRIVKKVRGARQWDSVESITLIKNALKILS